MNRRPQMPRGPRNPQSRGPNQPQKRMGHYPYYHDDCCWDDWYWDDWYWDDDWDWDYDDWDYMTIAPGGNGGPTPPSPKPPVKGMADKAYRKGFADGVRYATGNKPTPAPAPTPEPTPPTPMPSGKKE